MYLCLYLGVLQHEQKFQSPEVIKADLYGYDIEKKWENSNICLILLGKQKIKITDF